MKRQKKIDLAIICLLLLICTSCGKYNQQFDENKDKIVIIATLFPQYDFAKQIAGDYAEVKLLLPPGMESHSYDPSPRDIISISEADVFLYTGDEMETWAADLLGGIETSNLVVVDTSNRIELVKESVIEEEYEPAHEGHVHAHEHIYDPHIWTSPIHAKIMVENIRDGLIKADLEHEQSYRENADEYLKKLDELDGDIRKAVEHSERKEVFFGGRFALFYFMREYGLSYEAAYDSCSGETEPSAKAVAHIIDHIKEEGIPVIFYEELTDPRVAKTICEETGCEMLLFHSCHNVSKKELKDGITYLDLMRRNLENLKRALGTEDEPISAIEERG